MAGKAKGGSPRARAQATQGTRWLHKRFDQMERESRLRSKPARAAKAAEWCDRHAALLLPYERGKKAPVDSKGDDVKAARLIILE